MRQSGLYTVIFSLFALQWAHAQPIGEVRRFADRQLEKGNVELALKEYQRVLLFDDWDAHEDLYASIAGIYYGRQEFHRAIRYYDLAWNTAGSDSTRNELTFRKARCYFRLENFYLALGELYALPDSLPAYHAKKKALYAGICHFGLDDPDSSLESFSGILDTTGIRMVDSLYAEWVEYRRRYDPDRLQTMSIFLPGLGQLYGGEPAGAANSFLLLAASATYSYYTALNYSILDGLLFFASWFYRYYTGGHKNAYEIGVRLQEEKRDETFRRVVHIIRNRTDLDP